ncbi:hypothetical protein KIL84_012495 [Mauremys mutica]|uniref:EB1 C-terminal domain-containing protein n=1 Tax=Mauremys mutica TaxID=74926 RepID=A0A9D3XN47_9SAUR|nr:hypothetical protein KIL84_012495 [Mauremys mutica]
MVWIAAGQAASEGAQSVAAHDLFDRGSEADTQILELNQQLMDLKLMVDGLEKERNFYFSKLRDIELICQEHESENSPVIAGIIGILYATEEGFAPPEDDEVEDQQLEDQDEY